MADLGFETLLLSTLLRQQALASIHKWLGYKNAQHLHLEQELNRLESIWVACLDLIIETFPEEMRRSIRSDDQYPKLVLPTAVEKAFPNNEALSEILLIILEPSDDSSSPIRCNFSVTSLGSDCWPYDVLSYDRGVPTESKTIFLGEEEVHVPASLESALRQLRDNDTPLTLWVDRLCVVQQDPPDWQHGIDGMKAIYSNAQQVHVWLGDEMTDVEMAVAIVCRFIRDSEGFFSSDYIRVLSQREAGFEIIKLPLSWMEQLWWNHAGLMQELLCGCSVRFFWEGYSMTHSVKWDVLINLPRELRQAYLDDDPREPSNLRAFTEVPYLVPTDSLGYFPSFNVFDKTDQLPDSFDALCRVIKRIFTSPNKAQGWIFALTKVGKFLGVFLTHAAVRVCRDGPKAPRICASGVPETSKVGESSSLLQETISPATISSQDAFDNLAVMECWLHVLGKLGMTPKETDTISDTIQCQSNGKAYYGETSPVQALLLLPSDRTDSVLRGHVVFVDLNRLSAFGIASCPYFVVSHLFMDKDSTGSILLDGKEKKIPIELALSLQSIRHSTLPILLHIESPLMTREGGVDPWTREFIRSRAGSIMACECDQGHSGPTKETSYSPVDSSKAEIRIITIMHGHKRDPIQCHLDTVSLNDSPSYEALSYVWGDPSNPEQILLDGRRFSVTRNLACALEFLRHPTQDRTMWIDALCINQDDTAERNSQVQLMSRIYSETWQVVSWLGDRIVGAAETSQLISDTKGRELSVDWFRQELTPSFKPRQFRSIDHISRLLAPNIEYWGRAWITQEVALARKGILQLGEYVMEYDDVRRFIEAYETYIKNDSLQLTRIHGFKKALLLREQSLELSGSELQRRNCLGTPILKLLRITRHKKATDARDKVYALIGLSDICHSSHQGLRIDYGESRTIRDVYIGVVQAVVEETLSLDIICESADPRLSKSKSEVTKLTLPSWAPDWRNTAAIMPLNFDDPIGAAGGSPASVGFSAAGEILTAAGFRVGTVGRVGEMLPEYDIIDSGTRLSETWNISRRWHELAKGLKIDPCYRDELFSLTISAGIPLEHAVEKLDFTADKYDESPAQGETTSASGYTISPLDYQHATLTAIHRRSRQSSFFIIDPVDKDMASGLSRLPLMGLGLPTMKEGDIICILLGCKAPVVVRPHGGGFKLVSAVYIEPLMKGAAMEDLENGLYDLECFEIH